MLATNNNLVYIDYILNKDNNKENLETCVYKQIITPPERSKTKPKNRQNTLLPQILKTNGQLIYQFTNLQNIGHTSSKDK